MTSSGTIPSSFMLTLKTGSHSPKLKKTRKKISPPLFFFFSIFNFSQFFFSCQKLWQNDHSMKKYDILVPSPCINIVLGKCWVTKFPKINIELRGRGISYFVAFYCGKILMARIVKSSRF